MSSEEIPRTSSTRVVKGNQPLLLTAEPGIWTIASGAMALFAVKVVDGVWKGPRRCLCSLEVGEAVAGLGWDGKDYSIIAQSLEPTTLVKLTSTAGDISWVEKWRSRLLGALPEGELPTPDQEKTIGEYLQLLHGEFLSQLAELEREESDGLQRLEAERERFDGQVTENALADLASILKPQTKAKFQQGTPLLIAAGAVGRALGITIRPPQREDLGRTQTPLEAIAHGSGLRLRRVTLTHKWWKRDCGPLLGYTEPDNRPVALLPRGSKYEVFDPEAGSRRPVDGETKLAGVAYMFYRPLPSGELKALDIVKFALKGRNRDLLLLAGTGVGASLMGMLTPQVTAILIDSAIPDADRSLLLQLGLAMLATSFGSAIFQLGQAIASLRLQTISDSTTQAAVWDRLLKLKVSFFRQFAAGDLQSRVSAITQIRSQLSGTVLRTIFTSFFSLLNLGLLFIYSFPLAWVAIAIALVTVIATYGAGIAIRQQIASLQGIVGELRGITVQLLNGIGKLRVAGAENRAFAYWAKRYGRQLQILLSTQQIEDLLNLFNSILPTVSSAVLFWIAVYLIGESPAGTGLSTGTFLAFNAAFGTFLGGATSLSNTLIDLVDIEILWKRAQPILKAKTEVDTGLTLAPTGQLSGKLKLDHVTFRYRQDGPLVLHEVTISANPGEFIAIVGPSGSGKSTILRLLLGFETPQTGTIYYDGQDLSGLDISAVRRQLGVVLQNTGINSGSIFEQISGGALVTVDEAWSAAQMAGLADDIQSMPMGMHTIVSEAGSNLSGGQRQRLAIARSLVLKPAILLFDEATSALDNRTQAIVSKSLEELQVTRIVIAHRLSTIRKADRIYVIQAGRIVQQGNFAQLANQPGLFSQLMARQMMAIEN